VKDRIGQTLAEFFQPITKITWLVPLLAWLTIAITSYVLGHLTQTYYAHYISPEFQFLPQIQAWHFTVLYFFIYYIWLRKKRK
jgi:hypothetical protein